MQRILQHFKIKHTAILLCVLLFGYGLISLMIFLAKYHSGEISGDAASYLGYARQLAAGHLYLDGPIAEAIEQEADGTLHVFGPIWNNSVLPNGKTMFSVAIGYPLYLAALFKMGGAWLAAHGNIFLLAFVLLLLCVIGWELDDRSTRGWIVGAVGALLLVRTEPDTFLQFSYAWREPCTYLALLCSLWAFLIYLRSGRRRFLFLMALAAGYACAIKEVNAIYGAALGIAFLLSDRFKAEPHKVRLISGLVIMGLIGVSPLLVQNTIATGTPWVSLQLLRDKGNYSLTSFQGGMATGNVPYTMGHYLEFYKGLWTFHWAFLILAALGAWRLIKQPGGRAVVLIGLFHLALYAQWSKAEFRHMYLAHMPYVLCLCAGAFWLYGLLISKARFLLRFGLVIPFVVLAVLSFAPLPWKDLPEQMKDTLHPRDAVRLIDHLESVFPAKSILLSNRNLRDVLGAYGPWHVIREHDLEMISDSKEAADHVGNWLNEGWSVFFLDNKDQDPKTEEILNWVQMDYKNLVKYFTLMLKHKISVPEYKLSRLHHKKPHIGVYEINPWSASRVERMLPCPERGAAFLYLDPGSARSNLTIQLDGQPIPVPSDSSPFIPVYEWGITQSVQFVASANNGTAIPELLDTRLIGWVEPISLKCGADAIPDDASFFPDGLAGQGEQGHRRFYTNFRLRVPARNHPAFLSQLTLDVFREKGLGSKVETQYGDHPVVPVSIKGTGATFPLNSLNSNKVWSGFIDVKVFARVNDFVKMNGFTGHSIPTELHIDHAPNTHGVAFMSYLFTGEQDEGPYPWTISVNNEINQRGEFSGNYAENYVYLYLPAQKKATILKAEGVGFVEYKQEEISFPLKISARGVVMNWWFQEGFYEAEGKGSGSYRWTADRALLQVPVLDKEGLYQLTFKALDGHPKIDRPLLVSFLDQTHTVELNDRLNEYSLKFGSVGVTNELAHVLFQIEPWSPRKVLGKGGDKTLGFRFYNAVWDFIPNP